VTRLREDPELVLPEPPPSIPRLEGLQAGLAVAGPAGRGRLFVEGERTAVHAAQRHPAGTIRIGAPAVGPLRVELGSAANVVVSPGSARREWAGPEGTVLETIIAASTLPLVAIQWAFGGAWRPREITLGILAPDDRISYRVGPDSVVIRAGEEEVAVGLSPRPARLEIAEEGASGASLRIGPAPGSAGAGALTLIVAAGSASRVKAAFGAAAHLPAQARLAWDGPHAEGLSVSTGVSEVDDGVAWARWRLRGALSRHAESPVSDIGARDAPDPFWAALASVGIGDSPSAALGLEAIRGLDHERSAFLAAAIARTFGDARPAVEIARGLVSVEAEADDGTRRAALTALAHALHGSASTALLSSLRAAASRPEREARRLPMAGRAPAAVSAGAWLMSLLEGEPASPVPARSDEAESLLYALPSLFRSDPDRAWGEWRRRIAEGLADGPAGPGTWDDLDVAGPILVPITAALLLSLSAGLLGLSPDARLGRVRIGPRLPSHLSYFRADGITAGTTRLSLIHEREGAMHRYTLEPASAAVPPSVVFEPAVPGRVREIRVDGRPAELDARADGDRTIVPLQIPVDASRTVEIVTD
jgi:HPt (histidine-containing phosphotransfer) domain-containing protein